MRMVPGSAALNAILLSVTAAKIFSRSPQICWPSRQHSTVQPSPPVYCLYCACPAAMAEWSGRIEDEPQLPVAYGVQPCGNGVHMPGEDQPGTAVTSSRPPCVVHATELQPLCAPHTGKTHGRQSDPSERVSIRKALREFPGKATPPRRPTR